MIEDHTHCSICGKVCYYPDKPIQVQKAVAMKLCWTCYNYDEPDGIEDKEHPLWHGVKDD